eukprot:TRINITY_DN12432_c0_g1_i1.p1 TRINITY_DN12432_c0_g1~~TRINITY_DN12432_c0_g1_i1.p1  ORF type:complete len:440 (-),score=47.67 TRINITY_DN12432_c0_g1_i1:51-1334(-)
MENDYRRVQNSTTTDQLEQQSDQPQSIQPFRRINYPVFSKEIGRIGRSNRDQYNVEIKAIKDKIKVIKQNMRNDRKNMEKRAMLDELYESLRLLRGAQKQSRVDLIELRRVVKSECRRLKGLPLNDYDADMIELTADGDTWETRLPHMQKLFPINDDKLRRQYIQMVDQILSKASDSTEIIQSLQSLIDEVIQNSACQPHVINATEVSSLVYALGIPSNFYRMLEHIKESDKYFCICVDNSYHHDLFHKTVLLKGISGWKLRMHMFIPSDFTEAQEEVHSHRNHFVSYCVNGSLTQELWELPQHCTADEEHEFEVVPFHKYLYEPYVNDNGVSVFNIVPQGTIDLARVDQATVSKGGIYYMHPSVLHSVNAIDGCTVTLVLNSPKATYKSCFASLEEWKVGENFVRPKFTHDEMIEMFAKVKQLNDE